jgi:glycosyltransferase involved in cell wall biosynthesis
VKGKKLRILAVLPSPVRPDTASGDRRLFHILRTLATAHHLEVAVLNPNNSPEERRYEAHLESLGVRLLEPYGWRSIFAVTTRVYDVCIFEFWHSAESSRPFIHAWQPWVKVITDSVDVHFARELERVRLGNVSAAEVTRNKASELDAYRQSDAVITVTVQDTNVLLLEGGMPPCHLVSNAVPIRARESKQRGHDVVFVGGFKHHPNVDGIIWFVKECWAQIRNQVGDARLLIIGSNPPAEVQSLVSAGGVTVLGYVPSTDPYLDDAMVSIAPLRYGAGMKGKVCEAMASGLAVVTTSVGAQGLGAVAGENLLVADEPEKISEAVVALLRDPARCDALGLRGQELIRKICGEDVVAKQIDAMIAAVCPTTGRPRFPIKFAVRSLLFQGRRMLKSLARVGRSAVRRLSTTPGAPVAK